MLHCIEIDAKHLLELVLIFNILVLVTLCILVIFLISSLCNALFSIKKALILSFTTTFEYSSCIIKDPTEFHVMVLISITKFEIFDYQ